MITLIGMLIYLAGFVVTMGIGSRFFFNLERRHRPHDRAVSIYQDAVLQGAVMGLLWPIALPLLVLFGLGWHAARVAAPPEVRREVTAYNTAMMERMLGQKDDDYERRYSLTDE